MGCHNCEWLSKPAEVRRDHCIACSTKAYKKHRYNTNELSNKGQTIVSYDNHNSDMVDDRDVASSVAKDYLIQQKSLSTPDIPHPCKQLSKDLGMEVPEVAYEFVKKFIFELYELSEIQELLLRAIIKGIKMTEFAKSHGMTSAAVTKEVKAIINRSPIILNYVRNTTGGKDRLSRNGRKPSKPSSTECHPASDSRKRNAKSIICCGSFQLQLFD